MAFAEGTKVPADRSRAEIEALVRKAGARGITSGTEWDRGCAAIDFRFAERHVRFRIFIPTPAAAREHLLSRRSKPRGSALESAVADYVASEERRRWRCLLLVVKAKLESVESGIETFDQSFFAHVVTNDGSTLYERLQGSPMLQLGAGGASKSEPRSVTLERE